MRPEEVIRLLESVGAIRQGHFELSSGLHSGTYVQCAAVLQYPRYAEQLGRALAAEFHDLRVDCVASPAVGGIVLGHEVARAMRARFSSNVTLEARWPCAAASRWSRASTSWSSRTCGRRVGPRSRRSA